MEKVKIISAAEAHQRFAEITDEVRTKGATYSIVRHGKEVARLVQPKIAVEKQSTTSFDEAVKQFIDEYDEALTELAKR